MRQISQMSQMRTRNSFTAFTTFAIFIMITCISCLASAQDINYLNLVGKVYQHHLYKHSNGTIYQPRVFVEVYDTRSTTTAAAGNQATWFTCLTGCTNTTNILGCPNGSPVMVNDISLGGGDHVEVYECPDHVRGHCAGMTGFVNYYGGLGDVMVPVMLTLGFDESWCNH